jgi:hypothetical protein
MIGIKALRHTGHTDYVNLDQVVQSRRLGGQKDGDNKTQKIQIMKIIGRGEFIYLVRY